MRAFSLDGDVEWISRRVLAGPQCSHGLGYAGRGPLTDLFTRYFLKLPSNPTDVPTHVWAPPVNQIQ